jgi:Protein of unknown function (DUF732)
MRKPLAILAVVATAFAISGCGSGTSTTKVKVKATTTTQAAHYTDFSGCLEDHSTTADQCNTEFPKDAAEIGEGPLASTTTTEPTITTTTLPPPTTTTQPAPSTPDEAFLKVFHEAGWAHQISSSPAADAATISLAHSVCDAFGRGVSYSQVFQVFANHPMADGITPQEQSDMTGAVVYAAVMAYCPQHAGALPRK